jgi:glycosyltransferase involved in cell wall biosynthesis
MQNNLYTKKTLIVTSWAPPMIGGPQNLYSLFSLMDYRNYCVLTGYKTIINDGENQGDWLDGKYFFFDHPDMPTKNKTIDKVGTISPTNFITDYAYKLYNITQAIPVLNTLLYFLFFIFKTTSFIKKGLEVVRNEEIDIIFGMSDNGPSMIASYWISKISKRPLVYYLFDIYKGNNLQFIDKIMSYFWEHTLIKSAKLVIVTNDGTKDFYQNRYKNTLNIHVINNSGDSGVDKIVTKIYKPIPPYKIIYTGHVYWAQEQSLINLINAVKQINDLQITLELYIPNGNKNIADCVKARDNIILTQAPKRKMPSIQKQATLLFLPLSWNTRSTDIIKTATPGKYTEYLKSGRPMLVHAPTYAYISQYVKKNKLGIVVDKNDPTFLAKVIRNFIKDPQKGSELISKNLQLILLNL